MVDCLPGDIPDAVDHVVVVTAAEVRPAAACAEIVAQLRARSLDCSVVVRHRQWSGLDSGEVAALVHADPVAELPTVRGLTKLIETGGLPRRLPRGLASVARRVWESAGASAARRAA